jgi:hypothetical protein
MPEVGRLLVPDRPAPGEDDRRTPSGHRDSGPGVDEAVERVDEALRVAFDSVDQPDGCIRICSSRPV